MVSNLIGENNFSHPAASINRNINSNTRAGEVRLKTVALPVEHGGWGLALEPVVLGLILAPSLPGAFLALATMGAFLTRHPLKLAVADYRRGRRFARTPVAERFALLYGSLAALSLFAAIKLGPVEMLWPLVIAAPLAVVQLVYDSLGRSRSLLPELAGASALGAVASSLALAGGWRLAAAFALWAVLVARVVPTIMYVRARLMIAHGKKAALLPVLILHSAGFAIVFALAFKGLVPFLAVGAFGLLLLRSGLGFSERSRRVRAKRIGILELCYGAMTVLALAFGYAFGL